MNNIIRFLYIPSRFLKVSGFITLTSTPEITLKGDLRFFLPYLICPAGDEINRVDFKKVNEFFLPVGMAKNQTKEGGARKNDNSRI
jgi:hypothetical protein